MGRLLLSCVLGCAIFALIAWQFGFLSTAETNTIPSSDPAVKLALEKKLGPGLYGAQPWPKSPAQRTERRVDPVAVLGNMAVIDRPDIAAPIGGIIMFTGEEVAEGAMQVAGAAAFIVEPFNYASVNHGTREIVKPYRRLYEGQIVYPNQILAMVDTAKALGDIDMKHGKAIAADADAKGAVAIAVEAEEKLKTARNLLQKRALALEEFRSAVLTRDKMVYDSEAKVEAYKLALIEENMSRIYYKQHEIRNKVQRSVVQKIYKQRGEAVKEGEPVMQLYGLDRLLAEAQIDAEYSRRLHNGMLVTIEPSLVESPPKTYSGHVKAVNCLAVTHDAKNPLIVSGGEDRTVLIWNRFDQSYSREFKHSEAVKALACSPRSLGRNLLLTGCADGSIRLYNLDAKDDDKALIKQDADQGSPAITALAFSPDGKYFASGAADGSIVLWTTDKFERLYAFDEAHGVGDPHHGTITSLHFTPQCKLVSASMDNTLHVWSLREKGAVLDYALAERSGNVGQLDVTSNGRLMLFDQGKTLQLRSVADGRMVTSLKNPGGVIPFETLALFSPDASMLLTAGASEGRLQLWHTPTEGERAFEIRQFATPERAPVSCAAFAPLADYNGDGTFAVSANKDGQIYLWPLPSREDVDNHPIRNVRVQSVNAGLNAGTRQISFGVEVPNPPTAQHPQGRLEPGRPVTIVID